MRERIKFIAVTTGPMEFVFYDLFKYSTEAKNFTSAHYIFTKMSKSRFTGRFEIKTISKEAFFTC